MGASQTKRPLSQHSKEYYDLLQMLKFVRLPLINMKELVTRIKFSGFFED